eukprot:6972792-Heterocapsa_arctica.AAC.1
MSPTASRLSPTASRLSSSADELAADCAAAVGVEGGALHPLYVRGQARRAGMRTATGYITPVITDQVAPRNAEPE